MRFASHDAKTTLGRSTSPHPAPPVRPGSAEIGTASVDSTKEDGCPTRKTTISWSRTSRVQPTTSPRSGSSTPMR